VTVVTGGPDGIAAVRLARRYRRNMDSSSIRAPNLRGRRDSGGLDARRPGRVIHVSGRREV
jgi:hypothetical protein